MSELLNTPSQCNACPLLFKYRDDYSREYINQESAANRADIIAECFEEVVRETLDEETNEKRLGAAKKVAYQAVASMLNQADENRKRILVEVNAITANCEGLLTLSGSDTLGRSVVAKVCGSPFWRGTTTESAHVTRRDRYM